MFSVADVIPKFSEAGVTLIFSVESVTLMLRKEV